MPYTFADRVRETSTATGTASPITLLGAVATWQDFSAIGNGNSCYYAIIHRSASEWEVGTGTVTTGANNTLSRSSANVIASSAGAGVLVNFSVGVKDVICTAGATATIDMQQRKDVPLTSGTTINPRDVVYVGKADGKAYPVNAASVDAGLDAWIAGMSAETVAVSANNPVAVRIAGILGGFSGLTAGQVQYASTVAGGITNVPPTNVIPLAIAISATQVWINSVPNQTVPPVVNAQKGYLAGGDTATSGAGGYTSLCEKLAWTPLAISSLGTTLTQARSGLVAISEGSYKAFYCGGGTSSSGQGSPVTTGDLVTFATDTFGTVGAGTLQTARQWPACVGEGKSKGYIVGGITGTNLTTNSAELLVFPTAVTSALTGTLSQARWGLIGLSEGNSKGYFAGGDSTGAGGGITNTIDLVAFANDTLYSMTAFGTLSPVRRHASSGSDNVYRGYYLGGESTTAAVSAINNIDKIAFSTDTMSNAISTLSQARFKHSGQSGTVVCATAGGITGTGGGNTTSLEKFSFAPETNATTAIVLTVARDGMGSVSDIGFGQ